jgi:inner membrane protein
MIGVDPLTHTLVGTALARTRLGRTTGLAGTALALGANLPDVDVLSFVHGSDGALDFRRGWTHGPAGLVFLPPLLAGVLLLLDRWRRRRGSAGPPVLRGRLIGLAYLGCLTHPLLDWLNTYGIRLLMPFDDRWFYGDTLFIIDPWLWLMLGGAAFLGSERRGVPWVWLAVAAASSAIVLGGGRFVTPVAGYVFLAGLAAIAALRLWPVLRPAPGRAVATGLVLALFYIGAMRISTPIAASAIRAELGRLGVGEVRDLMVGPRPANPFARDVVVETATSYRFGSFRWLPRPTFDLRPRAIAKPAASPVLRAALDAPGVQGFLGWARYPWAEIDTKPDGCTVYLRDARYVSGKGRGFGTAVVELDAELRPRVP